MRPWYVASMLLLSGCAAELRGGQATDDLGLDPLGGRYNPRLAGCNVHERTVLSVTTFEYDSRGRIALYLYDSVDVLIETTTRWSGACRVNDTMEAPGGGLRIWEYDCDAEGWPVSGSERVLDSQLAEVGRTEFSWENTYEDDELVHVDAWNGDATDLEWADDRVVLRDMTNINGVLERYTYAYNDDGWILEMIHNELVATYTYDDQGRLISSVQGDTRTDWTYQDGAEWPYLRSYNGNVDEGIELQFDCP